MPDLARPWVLLLLLPLVVWVWRLLAHPGWVFSHPLPAGADGRGRSTIPPAAWLLRVGALASMVVALAGPRVPEGRAAPLREGVAIMAALDLSGSMATRDLAGRSRFEAAREELLRFLESRPDDRVGLVTFAEEGVTRVPPTLSHAHLRRAMTSLRLSELDQGTAMGVGLGLAAHRLTQVPAPSRVVILFSDGRSNMGALEPLSVARAAARVGIRVHAVGLGRGGGEDPLDEELLRGIAAASGGRYWRAGDGEGLAGVMADIDALERGTWAEASSMDHRSLHPAFLALALFLLLAEAAARARPGGRVR